MKIKSCLAGATIFGIAAGILRLLQYFFTIDETGFFKAGILSSILNIGLIVALGLGTLWIVICGFGGKKRETEFGALFTKGSHRAYFILLGLLAFADGMHRFFTFTDQLNRVVAILGALAGIIWILLGDRAVNGKGFGLFAAIPILQLGGVILSYFWQTYKYIHNSEYILLTLGLCAFLLFIMALLKPAADGFSTRQRLCATAGLSVIFSWGAFLPVMIGQLLKGFRALTFSELHFFLLASVLLPLAIYILKRLSQLPKEELAKEVPAPDLSHLNEFLSNLPEIDDEE